MTLRSTSPWGLWPGALALALLLPACSDTEPRAGRPESPEAAEAAAANDAGSEAPRPDAPGSQPAGPARRHPFVPTVDAAAQGGRLAGGRGPLELTAVFLRPRRAAIVREGTEAHWVHEGDYVGGHQVVAIRDGEVVLQGGRRRQILALYEPWAGGGW
ncbi:MAG: hypothetical protein ACLF0G_11555 [Candidatus Brocadiia bacterium]